MMSWIGTGVEQECALDVIKGENGLMLTYLKLVRLIIEYDNIN